jgi:signal transduction histidine kinase
MVPEEILIINDGSLLLKMMAALLENKGYNLCLTDSPEEALVQLSTRNVTLAVIKVNGQQNDRLAVMHMVKELNGGTRLIVVGEQTHLPAEIFEVEAEDYVILPCRIAEVWRRLSQCLEAPAAPAEVSRDDVHLHPVNHRLLHHLGLLFHDLRDLLTSINEGMRQLDRRLDGLADPEVEEIFQRTFQKTRTLFSLSQEFLQKFQAGGSAGNVGPSLDLREDVIEPVVMEFGEELQESAITLENRITAPPQVAQSVRGDQAALKSIFRNILHNAISQGGSGCTISIDVDEHPDYYRLQVHNNGVDRSLIGRPGRSTGNHAIPLGTGRGASLGLHLGREVMRSQGGDISYEPCRQGANFVMTLPRA